jgi:SAM-dependent methyltransferase
MPSNNDAVFAEPRTGLQFADCHFYHTMEIPGVGLAIGDWDLRAGVEAYLGGVDLRGKRVLEIGPASGFLTFEMEKRGAAVTAIEVEDDPGWDFVPYPPQVLAPVFEPRREIMRRLKNSWWFNHAAFASKAKLAYADAYALPDSLGTFDVAIVGSLLLHTRAPLQILEQCATRAETIIVTDMFFPDLEGSPVCRLAPTAANGRWDTWWEFSSDFVRQFLGVMGFVTELTTHSQPHRGHPYQLFTVAGRRDISSVGTTLHGVAD